MKYFLSLLILFTTLLQAQYPEAFSDLATPLYKADNKFSKLPEGKAYSPKVLAYHTKQAETLELSKADKGTYFKALRDLTKEHDAIIALAKREMVNSIRNDDILTFQALNETHLEEFYTQESFRKRIFTYYINNQDHYSSTYLNKKIRAENSYDKQYGVDVTGPGSSSDDMITSSHHKRPSKVIVLSRPGCPWCTKTKDFLKLKHISYVEYNVQSSSKGKSLFKKYKGSGVPLVIIGDTVLRGFDPSGIMDAI